MFSQEQNWLSFRGGRGGGHADFFPRLRDCKVPDALCKTMPHREGKCEVRLEATLKKDYKQQLLLLCVPSAAY